MKKILFVDDDQFIQKIYSDRLTSEGYEVECVNSGKKAKLLLEKNQYDLISVDNTLPDMSGAELIVFIKEKKITAPVLSFSAEEHEADIEKIRAAGVTEVIPKSKTVPGQYIEIIKKYI